MEYKEIKLSTEFIKLGQLLKYVGVISNGSDAKYFLNKNVVKVNDCIEVRRGRKLYAMDTILINGIKYILKQEG